MAGYEGSERRFALRSGLSVGDVGLRALGFWGGGSSAGDPGVDPWGCGAGCGPCGRSREIPGKAAGLVWGKSGRFADPRGLVVSQGRRSGSGSSSSK